MSNYRLDRTAVKAQTAEEAANHADYYKQLIWQERLRIANYLNSVAYNYPENEPPKWIGRCLAQDQESKPITLCLNQPYLF